jgi:hypothetical protein
MSTRFLLAFLVAALALAACTMPVDRLARENDLMAIGGGGSASTPTSQDDLQVIPTTTASAQPSNPDGAIWFRVEDGDDCTVRACSVISAGTQTYTSSAYMTFAVEACPYSDSPPSGGCTLVASLSLQSVAVTEGEPMTMTPAVTLPFDLGAQSTPLISLWFLASKVGSVDTPEFNGRCDIERTYPSRAASLP